MFLAERILILGCWLFVLISYLCGFLLLVFALAIKVGTLGVHLLSLISVLFFGYLYDFLVSFFFSVWMASDSLRSVGGLQVASGWLVHTSLGLCVLASGWFTQILLALFVLCYSQWVACA